MIRLVNALGVRINMSQQNENSVEEILDSIKKVIARDNREMAAANRKRLETDGVRKDEPAVEEATPAQSEEVAEEVLDLGEMEFVEDIDPPVEADVETGTEPEAALQDAEDKIAQEDTAMETDSQEGLTGHHTRDSMRENLAALAMLAQPGAQPQIVRSGETSLEGLAREMLKPMLAEWLDTNLPDMVERMVQEEIARIVRKDS